MGVRDVTELRRRTVRVGEKGVEAGVVVGGQGPPLVFFHAAAGFAWDGFLDSLSERYTVHAVEHPGTTEGNPEAIHEVDDLWDRLSQVYMALRGEVGEDSPIWEEVRRMKEQELKSVSTAK